MAACSDDDPVAVDSNADPTLGSITIEAAGGQTGVVDVFHFTTTLLGAPNLLVLETDIADHDHADPRKRYALLMDSSHPSFADIAARLTDGADGTLQYQYSGAGSSTTFVGLLSSRIHFAIARAGGEPDFVGYEITALRLTIARANFESPGQDLNGNGMWTDYELEIEIHVEGRPE